MPLASRIIGRQIRRESWASLNFFGGALTTRKRNGMPSAMERFPHSKFIKQIRRPPRMNARTYLPIEASRCSAGNSHGGHQSIRLWRWAVVLARSQSAGNKFLVTRVVPSCCRDLPLTPWWKIAGRQHVPGRFLSFPRSGTSLDYGARRASEKGGSRGLQKITGVEVNECAGRTTFHHILDSRGNSPIGAFYEGTSFVPQLPRKGRSRRKINSFSF